MGDIDDGGGYACGEGGDFITNLKLLQKILFILKNKMLKKILSKSILTIHVL